MFLEEQEHQRPRDEAHLAAHLVEPDLCVGLGRRRRGCRIWRHWHDGVSHFAAPSKRSTAGILPRSALSYRRIASLGATRDCHHGLPGWTPDRRRGVLFEEMLEASDLTGAGAVCATINPELTRVS